MAKGEQLAQKILSNVALEHHSPGQWIGIASMKELFGPKEAQELTLLQFDVAVNLFFPHHAHPDATCFVFVLFFCPISAQILVCRTFAMGL